MTADTPPEPHEHTPADLACLTTDGDDVFVVIDADVCEHHGRHQFITIGVRDSDSDDDVICRDDFRELINIGPHDAIRLARSLLDYATDMLDDDDDDEQQK